MTKENKITADEAFEIEVQHAMDIMADLVPYNDPNYNETLMRMAEQFVKEINDPNSELNKAARWNDENGQLPHYEDIDFGEFLKGGES